MRILVVSLVALAAPLIAESERATASSARFAELRKQSEQITTSSSEEDVISLLGEPQCKGSGGWGHLDRKVWCYLSFTNDSLHQAFSVSFDTKTSCSVSQVEISREELKKSPLHVSTGTVLMVYRDYPTKGGEGFLCDVRFNRDVQDITIGVSVGTLDRVKGTPQVGESIRVEKHL